MRSTRESGAAWFARAELRRQYFRKAPDVTAEIHDQRDCTPADMRRQQISPASLSCRRQRAGFVVNRRDIRFI